MIHADNHGSLVPKIVEYIRILLGRYIVRHGAQLSLQKYYCTCLLDNRVREICNHWYVQINSVAVQQRNFSRDNLIILGDILM